MHNATQAYRDISYLISHVTCEIWINEHCVTMKWSEWALSRVNPPNDIYVVRHFYIFKEFRGILLQGQKLGSELQREICSYVCMSSWQLFTPLMLGVIRGFWCKLWWPRSTAGPLSWGGLLVVLGFVLLLSMVCAGVWFSLVAFAVRFDQSGALVWDGAVKVWATA